MYDEDDSEPADDADQVVEKKPQLYAPSSGFDFGDSFGDLSVDFDAPVAAAAEANPGPGTAKQRAQIRPCGVQGLDCLPACDPGRQGLMDVLQLDKPSIEALVDELITSGYRLDCPVNCATPCSNARKAGHAAIRWLNVRCWKYSAY